MLRYGELSLLGIRSYRNAALKFRQPVAETRYHRSIQQKNNADNMQKAMPWSILPGQHHACRGELCVSRVYFPRRNFGVVWEGFPSNLNFSSPTGSDSTIREETKLQSTVTRPYALRPWPMLLNSAHRSSNTLPPHVILHSLAFFASTFPPPPSCNGADTSVIIAAFRFGSGTRDRKMIPMPLLALVLRNTIRHASGDATL